MAERPAKRYRLGGAAARSGVSDSALSRILDILAEEPAEAARASRRQLARRTEDSVLEATPYGPCLQPRRLPLETGGEYTWAALNPFAMLWLLWSKCAGFQAAVRTAHARIPSSRKCPWNIILYNDEVAPGNLLKTDNTRKLQVFYWSFKEFDHELLCREALWLLGGIIPSRVAGALSGGLAFVFRLLLESFFGPQWNMATSGIVLPGPEPLVLFARMTCNVSDESALKHCWQVKGASGARPCLFCKNVLLDRLGIAEHDEEQYLVDLGNLDATLWDRQTDDSMWEAADLLASQATRLNRGQFAELERSLGMNHEPRGVLLSRQLRPFAAPISCIMWDWLHVWLVNGIFHWELHLFLGCLKRRAGIGYPELANYLAAWRWPADVKSHAPGVFNEKRAAASTDSFKAGASECLTFYPVLRFLLQKEVAPKNMLQTELASLFALFSVIDALVRVRRHAVTPAELSDRIMDHLTRFRIAYPDEQLRPKHHYAVHVPELFSRHGTLYSCFVHERRHRQAKQLANNVRNTQALDKSVLIDLIAAHMDVLHDEESTRCGMFLVDARTAPQEALSALEPRPREALWAKSAYIRGARVSRGDVTLNNSGGETWCGQVAGFLAADGDRFAVLSRWRRLDAESWTMARATELLPLDNLGPACIWSVIDQANAAANVVLPPGWA